ncbi:MAG: NAD(P)-binding protein [bacterium]|nr:NAD(P)-binding protein [bacterium]
MDKIGVFVCHCGRNIAGTVDVDKVVDEIKSYPGVSHCEHYKYMCSEPGQQLIRDAVKSKKLNGVVVAACSPTLHETTFRRTVESVGLNPYRYESANIREHCSWVHKDMEVATPKAVKIIKSLVEKVKQNDSLVPIGIPVTRRALVIGGGIAGIQASLDIANSGYEVILVEKEPSIGGHMAQLSETFPTLDCSQCILTPRMVEVGQHKNIKLYTYSEIDSISGYVGNFKVKIKRKSPYIDWDKCNGCGECSEVCPVKISSEFDVELSTRKAIYRPFPQAVPNRFVIDKRGVSPCKYSCPAGVNVQGYVALISQGKYKEALALERDENPFPMVCGRVCNHPCETECKRGDIDEPISIRSLKRFIADYETKLEKPKKLPEKKKEKVAIVGSGPAGLSCAWKLAQWGYKVAVFEALPFPGGMLRVGIPEFRLPRDVLNKDIEYITNFGVEIKTNTKIGKELTVDDLFKQGYRAVFLAIGAHKESKLGVEGEDLSGVFSCIEFLRAVNMGNKVSIGKRVAVIGGGNAAVDAARASLRLGAKDVVIVYRRSRAEMPANEEEIIEAEREGVNIEYLTAPIRILGEEVQPQTGKVIGMECIRMRLGPPDASGRRRPIPIEGSEFTDTFDTIITAIGQSPDISWLPKDSKLRTTKWSTFEVDPDTLETSIPGVFAGGDAVSGPATVIEAIAGGKEAAISIDRFIRGIDLKEGRKLELKRVEEIEIPKWLERRHRERMPSLPIEERRHNFKEVNIGFTEEQAKLEAIRCLACGGCSECGECEKVCEPEAIVHDMADKIVEEEVGAIVVATGYELYPIDKIGEYGAGKYKDVLNGLQFERLLSASGPTEGEIRRPSDGKIPKRVVFVSCVGSRDPENHFPYCSKICCMYTAKHAMLYKHHVPDGEAIVFYIDIRSDGKGYEEFVTRAQEEDRVLYIRGKVSKIFEVNGSLIIMGADTLTGKQLEIKCDMVVLSMAIVPSNGIEELIRKLKIHADEHGFLSEAHPKLRPVETLAAGFYLAGAAQSPRDIPDTVAQASGAASKVLELFSQPELKHEPIVATVDEDLCSGCAVCIPLCPYEARKIEPKDEKRIAKITEVLCEGCGSCVSACPSGASQLRNLKDNQLFKMVEVVLE